MQYIKWMERGAIKEMSIAEGKGKWLWSAAMLCVWATVIGRFEAVEIRTVEIVYSHNKTGATAGILIHFCQLILYSAHIS